MTIDTIKGPMDASRLSRRVAVLSDGSTRVEYYDGPELVHRSVVIALTGLAAEGAAKSF